MPAKKVTIKGAAKTTTSEKAVEKATVKKTSPKTSATKKASSKTAAKKPTAKKSVTTIVVKYDVGMGNNLVLRGDSPGLSWNTGTTMENLDAETWRWTTSKARSVFEVKFLINDTTWSQGENESVKPGTTSGFAPRF